MNLIKEIQFVKINDDKFIMINLINGVADIINNNTYTILLNNTLNLLDEKYIDIMKKRKYLFENENDYTHFLNELNSTLEMFEKNSAPNFLIIPSYACNLNCTYCYEKTYSIDHISITDKKKIVDNQLEFISKIKNNLNNNNLWKNSDIKITLMGGEPLLPGNLMIISYILKQIKKNGYKVNVVTNGVDVLLFISYLKDDIVEHIQITLDGPKNIHDKRRLFHNGEGSFDKIISNIKTILDNKIKVYLRVNVDDENIDFLPELADVIISNFSDNSYLQPYIYLLQDGGCSGDQNVIDENIGIEKIIQMEKKYPNIKIFKKRFHPMSLIESIFQNKQFNPSLSHCGAARNQYILDYKGNVYKCWHGIGNSNYKVGNFGQEIEFNNKIDQWKNRNVKNIKECNICKYRYICGTGCPAAKHTGSDHFDINKPSCVDYEKLINRLV